VNNSYELEIVQGPLLAPVHVTGVGGAYVAFAQDTEGSAVNAASPAVRDPYSITWFDYDLSAGFSLPGFLSGQNTDFDNRGPPTDGTSQNANVNSFVDLNFGATLQFGGVGVAATGDLQQFNLTKLANGLTMEVGRWKALGAYGLFDGQLVIGAGARILTMQIAQSGGQTLLTVTGAGPEVGALLMPTGSQWRVGAAARGPVGGGVGGDHLTKESNGVLMAGNFVLPSTVESPWEVDMGIAYQLGPRPLNPGWENPHEQANWLRQRIAEQRAERALLREAELGSLTPDQRLAREPVLDAEEARQQALEDAQLQVEIKRLYDQRKARYDNWPREKILLLASVLLTGASSNAVSLQGFLDQRVETVGKAVTVTPRLGMEGEPLRDRMTLRVGTYVEPSRYETGTPRQHFTFGGDVRLFPIDFWGLLPRANLKFGFVIDLAPRYQNYGLAIGNWH
jgi:hypothetical protein